MKNTINNFGWTGLLIMFTIMLFSCKKEENKSASTGTPIVLTSELVGKYANTDANVYTRDTIYIYHDGVDYRITCPDNNAQMDKDTLGCTIDGDDITIPTQVIYGTSFIIDGYGSKVLSNQIILNWTTTLNTQTNVIYIKQ